MTSDRTGRRPLKFRRQPIMAQGAVDRRAESIVIKATREILDAAFIPVGELGRCPSCGADPCPHGFHHTTCSVSKCDLRLLRIENEEWNRRSLARWKHNAVPVKAPTPESKLKVYAIHDGTVEKMVAAKNRTIAAGLLTVTVSGLRSWGTVVCLPGALRIARSKPGTVFYHNVDITSKGDEHYHLTYEAARLDPNATRNRSMKP